MNYNDTKKLMKQYLMARIPFISFNTVEKTRATSLLKEIANENNLKMSLHSMSKGFTDLSTGEVINPDKLIMGALDFISEELKTKEKCIYILSDVSEIDADTFTARYFADIVTEAEKKNSSIIVITSNPVWVHLARLGMTIELGLPDETEILNIIKDNIEPYKNSITVEWDENDFKDAANILLGISKIEVKNVIASLIAKGNVLKTDLIDLKFAKDSLFSNINGLEKINVEENVAFGGLENLKAWLNDKKKLLSPEKKEELQKKGIRTPRGVLLLGVAGCGKSLSAKAIASMWKLPLYRLDFATIQGRYVGQSEQQLKEAFETAEHVSPCILWIDEIEKGLAGDGKDSSGVTQRLIGQFLFWLQECRKDVFIVATANNVNELPPELLRKGRFDELFFVDLPNKKERMEIINLYVNKYLNVKISDSFLEKLADLSNTFSGSDIESRIRELAYKVVSDNVQITEESLTSLFTNTISSYQTNKEKVEALRNWAKTRTVPATKSV